MSGARSVKDYVDDLKQELKIKDQFNFSILVEQEPIKQTYNYFCKVLAVIIKTKSGSSQTIHYDKIKELEYEFIEPKESARRKMGVRKLPFFIDGSSEIKTYKDHEFIEYNFRNPNKNDLKFIEKIRAKFNIEPPHIFKSEALHFDDDLLLD